MRHRPKKFAKALSDPAATPKATQTHRKQHDASRRKAYKRKQRAQQLAALQAALNATDDDVRKQQLTALKGVVYGPRKQAGEQLAALQKLVAAQQEEIRSLRGLNGVSRLEPTTPSKRSSGAEADSSPVKIAQQLLGSDVDAEGEDVADEVTLGVSAMEGVEGSAVGYPTLPSVEDGDVVVEEVKETIERDDSDHNAAEKLKNLPAVTPVDTPSKGKKNVEVRDSSADSNAGTPRNVRRSPRKKTVKRRSFAGHSYAG